MSEIIALSILLIVGFFIGKSGIENSREDASPKRKINK